MSISGQLLTAAVALCQLAIVFLSVREFIRLVSLNGDPTLNAGERSPATVAMVIQAAIFNCSILVLALPDLLKGKVSDGLALLSGAGFVVVGLSFVVTSVVTKSQLGTRQVALSAFGLLCLFLLYYLSAEG